MLVSEREDLLAEGVRARTGEFMPKATGEGVEPCKTKLLAEPLAGKPDAWVAWAGAMRTAAAAAWSLRRVRAFRVAVASGDEAGGQWEEGRKRRDVFK